MIIHNKKVLQLVVNFLPKDIHQVEIADLALKKIDRVKMHSLLIHRILAEAPYPFNEYHVFAWFIIMALYGFPRWHPDLE